MMETALKYTTIKDRAQYNKYCELLEEMVFSPNSEDFEDEIDLVTMLIEKYDEDYIELNVYTDPVKLLHSFMEDHNLKDNDLAKILDVSTGLISDILNYKKGISKEVIRKLATHFKVRQEAFSQPYFLKNW